jgi:hypothetical protein
MSGDGKVIGPFVGRVARFVALQALVLAALVAVAVRYPMGEGNYLRVWGEKDRRLAQAGPPRVLLVGGSNLPFGMDSAVLEKALGRPVLNLGLHFGIGRELMLGQAEAHVRAGDVVVVSLEHVHLFRRFQPVLTRLLAVQPAAARYVGWAEVPVILDDGLMVLGNLARHPSHLGAELPPTIYSREYFDERGDNRAPRHLPSRAARRPAREAALLASDGEPFEGFSEEGLAEGVARLNLFTARCRARGATAVYSFPPILHGQGERHAAVLRVVAEQMRSTLEMPLLDEPAEMLWPLEDFFDSGYHLTDQATRRRTAHVAERLGPYVRSLRTGSR